ncbi:MAG TPA: ABC transporter permease, partial [Lachnospiraceae bacterium]|nr:ABC transporter permease [Lachnospiraceae bacterium]
MAQLLEYVKLALMNIKSNKVRTALTMLGIIIGVSSVILIISVGNGIKGEINGALNNIAGGQIYIQSVKNSEDNEFIEFTTEDFDVIKEKVEGVTGVTPMSGFNGEAYSNKGSFTAYTYAGTESMEKYFRDPLLYGRYFTKEEYDAGANVCIVLEQSAVHLFGTADVVGMTVELTFGGQVEDFTIIGV